MQKNSGASARRPQPVVRPEVAAASQRRLFARSSEIGAGGGIRSSHLATAASGLGLKARPRRSRPESERCREQPAGVASTAVPPLSIPLALCELAEEALGLIRTLVPQAEGLDFHGGALLLERARVFGFAQPGQVSCGGSCRLIDAKEGMMAVNLARPSDWELLPAWLEAEIQPMDWERLAQLAGSKSVDRLVQRGRELGLAVSRQPIDARPRPPDIPTLPFASALKGILGNRLPRKRAISLRPKVIDLSSLWAGPLCGNLLQLCGAEVIKVESIDRPDGARNGPPAFFDRLNAGKRSVAVDFSTIQGRRALGDLLRSADIVIEASRPRALAQLGFEAEAFVEEFGCTWVSITGFGRQAPGSNWIAFGDDAAIAAGFGAWQSWPRGEKAGFVGDAIADPLTGLHAALLALLSQRFGGGGQLLDVSLTGIARECLEALVGKLMDACNSRLSTEMVEASEVWLQRPAAAAEVAVAASLGQHNAEVFAPC